MVVNHHNSTSDSSPQNRETRAAGASFSRFFVSSQLALAGGRVNFSTVVRMTMRYRLIILWVALVACLSGTACSKLAYRIEKTLKVPSTITAEYRAGKREAEAELSQGHLRYQIYGLGETWDGPDLYAEHLRNDYGIELVHVAGCVVTEELELHTQGYDDTMLTAIETRYGKNLLKRVHDQAVDEWKRTHKSS